MVKIGKKRVCKRKKSHIKVNQKVFSVRKMKRDERKEEHEANNKWNYYITDEKKWTNHETHSHPHAHIFINSMVFRMQPKRKSVKRKSFQCMCSFSLHLLFTHPLTHTFRSYLWCALIEMKRFARLFQVVMAVATTMNENNNV